MAGPTDNELIEQIKGGDQHAFSVFYDRYEARIFNYVARMFGDEHLAREATQDTFLTALKIMGRYQKGESAQGWLYAIAHNKARELFRARKRKGEVSIDQPVSEEHEATTLSELIQAKGRDPREVAKLKQCHEAIQNASDVKESKRRSRGDKQRS